MQTALCTVVGACITFLMGPALADDAKIGMVKTIKGSVAVIRDGSRAELSLGDIVQQNDILETGRDGAVGVTFIDNTTLSLGSRTKITLTEYVFHPSQNRYAFVMEVTKGTLMFVSGMIEKFEPDAVSIHTSVGTVGVRGTRLLIEVPE